MWYKLVLTVKHTTHFLGSVTSRFKYHGWNLRVTADLLWPTSWLVTRQQYIITNLKWSEKEETSKKNKQFTRAISFLQIVHIYRQTTLVRWCNTTQRLRESRLPVRCDLKWPRSDLTNLFCRVDLPPTTPPAWWRFRPRPRPRCPLLRCDEVSERFSSHIRCFRSRGVSCTW